MDIVDELEGGVIRRLECPSQGLSQVLFSPDGKPVYVNHMLSPTLDIIDVEKRKIGDVIKGLPDTFYSDMMISADGQRLWLVHKNVRKLPLSTRNVIAFLDTGSETNHPNFTRHQLSHIWICYQHCSTERNKNLATRTCLVQFQ